MLGIVTTIKIAPGRSAEFEAIVRAVAENSLAQEPGCVGYQGFRQQDDSDGYIVVEQYIDRGALAAHREASYFCAAMEKLAGLVVGEPLVVFCDVL